MFDRFSAPYKLSHYSLVTSVVKYGGPEVKKLARNLPDAVPVVGDANYKKLNRNLSNHFLLKKSKHHASYTISKQRPEGETVAAYAARLREKQKTANSGIRSTTGHWST